MSGRMICGANHSKDRRSKPWLIITQSSCSFSGSFRDMNSKPRPASTSEVRGYSVTGCSIGFRQWKWDRNGPGRREVTAVARCALRRLSIVAGRFCRMGTVSLPGWRGLQAGLAGRTATPGGARPAGLLRWRPRKRGTRPERTLRTAASVLWAFPSVRRRNPRVAGAGGCGRLGVR